MHFSLSLTDGTEAVSTFGEEPATVIIGDGSLSEGLETALYGLRSGDRQTLTLTPDQAFGDRDEAKVQSLPRKHFPPEMELTGGLVVAFETATGEELAGMIKDTSSEQDVVVDFNHPLAGRAVIFTAEILSVEWKQ